MKISFQSMCELWLMPTYILCYVYVNINVMFVYVHINRYVHQAAKIHTQKVWECSLRCVHRPSQSIFSWGRRDSQLVSEACD